jgi:hypothetical protein
MYSDTDFSGTQTPSSTLISQQLKGTPVDVLLHPAAAQQVLADVHHWHALECTKDCTTTKNAQLFAAAHAS